MEMGNDGTNHNIGEVNWVRGGERELYEGGCSVMIQWEHSSFRDASLASELWSSKRIMLL
jgi:hypothetical protein